MRQKSLALTEKLLYVIKQQVRVFRECQDSIYAAQEKREIPQSFHDLVNDNLEKLEREFPDIIRRIFRSFPKFCMELRKLSPRPFSSKVKNGSIFCLERYKILTLIFSSLWRMIFSFGFNSYACGYLLSGLSLSSMRMKGSNR